MLAEPIRLQLRNESRWLPCAYLRRWRTNQLKVSRMPLAALFWSLNLRKKQREVILSFVKRSDMFLSFAMASGKLRSAATYFWLLSLSWRLLGNHESPHSPYEDQVAMSPLIEEMLFMSAILYYSCIGTLCRVTPPPITNVRKVWPRETTLDAYYNYKYNIQLFHYNLLCW